MLHPKWTATLVSPVFMTRFMPLDGVEQAADCNTGETTDALSPMTFSGANDPRPLVTNDEAQLPAASLLLLTHARPFL